MLQEIDPRQRQPHEPLRPRHVAVVASYAQFVIHHSLIAVTSLRLHTAQSMRPAWTGARGSLTVQSWQAPQIQRHALARFSASVYENLTE